MGDPLASFQPDEPASETVISPFVCLCESCWCVCGDCKGAAVLSVGSQLWLYSACMYTWCGFLGCLVPPLARPAVKVMQHLSDIRKNPLDAVVH